MLMRCRQFRQRQRSPRGALVVICQTCACLFVSVTWADAIQLVDPRRLSDSASDILALERPTSSQHLQPRSKRSEIEGDRARSLALFGKGRILYQRGKFAAALKAYQRAYHWNPDPSMVPQEIIPLAFYLERPGVATRYAILAAERKTTDTELLRQLALHLTQQEDYDRALRFYDRMLKLLADQPLKRQWVVTHFEAGRLNFLTDHYHRAADSFVIVDQALKQPDDFELDEQTVRQIEGKPHLTYTLMGEAFLEADRLDRAEELFRRADKRQPNKPLLAYHLTRLAMRRNQPDKALANLEEYLAAQADDAGEEPYQFLKELLPLSADDSDNWLTRLEELYKTAPNPALTSFLAKHYDETNNREQALTLLQKLAGEQPSGFVYQRIVAAARKQRTLQPIVETLGSLAAKTNSIDLLGDELKELVQDEQLCEQLINTAKKLAEPLDAQAAERVLGVALLAIKAQRFEDAELLTNRAIEHARARTPAWQFATALEFFLADQSQRAAQLFQQLADSGKADDTAGVEFYLATSLELAGETDKALVVMDKAIRRTTDAPLLLSRRAWIAYHAERNDEAEKLYRQFVEKFDSDFAAEGTRELLKEARMSLSNLALIRKDVDGAIEWLQDILDEYPEEVGAMNDLGYLFADENRHLVRALRMSQFAVDHEPENVAYLDTLGWTLFRLDRYEEAATYLRRAAAGADADGIILDHLGDVYAKLKRTADAKQAWTRAINAFRQRNDEERLAATEAKITENGTE